MTKTGGKREGRERIDADHEGRKKEHEARMGRKRRKKTRGNTIAFMQRTSESTRVRSSSAIAQALRFILRSA